MLNRIQGQLIKQYPQLENKANIFEHYVSLEFPDKQRKMISWWQEMIEAAIRKSGDISLSPADLEVIFSLHGLKPVPLEKILEYLTETNRIEWEGKQEQKNKENNQGWLGTIASYIWKPKETTLKSGFKSMSAQQNERIMSTNYNNELKNKIKQTINKELQQQKSISYEYILDRLKQEMSIGVKAIEVLLGELGREKWLVVDSVQERKIIIRSDEAMEMKDKNWVEVEKSKFMLKSAIEQFDRKIDQRLKYQDNKLQEAKKYVESDQNRAKRVLGQVRALKKTTDQYQNRRKLLKQTLDELQINQINSVTIGLVGECQKIVQKTMIDASEFENIKDKHLEIAVNQKQINQQLEQISGMGSSELEDEVDTMMAELEKEIKKKSTRKVEIQKSGLKTEDQKQQYHERNLNIN